MAERSQLREHCLIDVLASKHYPQVFRVTRPYVQEGRECLKCGQYITVLQRKKVEIITGVASDGRYCKVRKDRQAHVEVLEEERIVYSLSVVAEVAPHIEAIEFRKEIRFDKNTFEVGERFTIEKVGKSFRGKTKNIGLRRQKDNKVYRFPLDVIGMFKLLAGKTLLPLSRILSLRSPPLKVQFANIQVSSNFPSGIITLEGSILCDLVYTLVVTKDTYQYEVFSIDSDIFVEKTDLQLPKPIRSIIPNGIYVNSVEYNNVMKAAYKHKLSEIDSKIVEDIYSNRYYGSASIEKNSNDDSHLFFHQRRPTSMQLESKVTSPTSAPMSPANSEFSSESDNRPAPLPRYSKKHRSLDGHPDLTQALGSRAIITVQKSQLMKGNVDLNDNLPSSRDSSISAASLSGSESGRDTPVSPASPTNPLVYAQVRKPGRNESTRSRSSESSCSSRMFYSPYDDIYSEENAGDKESTLGKNDNLPPGKQLVMWGSREKLYESPNAPPIKARMPSSSSLATEDSGDSGVVVSFSSKRNDRLLSRETTFEENEEQVRNWSLMSNGQVRKLSITRTPNPIQHVLTEEERKSGFIQVDNDIDNSPKPPIVLPRAVNIYQNIHSAGAEKESFLDGKNSGGDKHSREHAYEELPYQNLRTVKVDNEQSEPSMDILVTTDSQQLHVTQMQVNKGNEVLNQHRRNEIASMAQSDVGRLLGKLNFHKYIPSFSKELINGQLLLELDEETLVNDLRMTKFEARKLHKYANGWRPITSDINGNDPIRVPQNKIDNWSVSTVVNELKKINSEKLALFCELHQIDGPFLKDLIEQNLVCILREDHGVLLNGIEQSRLKAFVLKDWRPDSPSQVSPLSGLQPAAYQQRITDRRTPKITGVEKRIKPIWGKLSS